MRLLTVIAAKPQKNRKCTVRFTIAKIGVEHYSGAVIFSQDKPRIDYGQSGPYTEEQLQALKDTDIHIVNRDERVDVSTVYIDTTLPRQEATLPRLKAHIALGAGSLR